MRSREAWLALVTAVLGVDAAGCRQDGPLASPAGSVEITGVPSARPAVAATPSADASLASAGVDASSPTDAALASGPGDAGKRAAAKPEDGGVDLATLLAGNVDVLSQGLCGVSTNDGNLKLQGGCGARRPGYGGGIGTFGSPVDAGPTPKADATLTTVSGGAPSDARILAGLRPGMKACFNQALSQDPSAADGRVTLTVSIAPNGEVSTVTPGSSTLPTQDIACVTRRVKNLEFDGPGGSGRTLVITVDQKKVR